MKPRLVTRKCSRLKDHARKKVPYRIKLPRFSLEEVEAAIMQSKPDKAPDLEGTTFRVWQELWPVLCGAV